MIRCLLLLALALWFAVVVLLLAGYAKAQGVSQGNARTDTRVRVGTIPNEGETVDGIFLVPTPGTVNPVGYIPTAPGAGRSSNLKPHVIGASELETSAGVGPYEPSRVYGHCPWAKEHGVAAVRVTSDLICKTQHAIRWKDPAWAERECEAQAQAFITSGKRWGFDPLQLFAMAIAESDLRPKAMRDNGDGNHPAVDVGEMAIRCVLSPDISRDKCRNKPVRGMDIPQLFDPAVNIEKGAEILATLHHGDLAGYNSGHKATERDPVADRYPSKVAAIMSALGGVKVRVKGARMKKLVGQIAKAARP